MVNSWISRMHFIHFTNRLANGQWSLRFCRPPQIFFSCVLLVFWTILSKSTYGRLVLKQYFSFRGLVKFLTNLMIIYSSKRFFRDPLYDCIWLLYLYVIAMMQLFVYGPRTLFTGKITNQPTNQPNKQTNKQIKQSLDWLKDLSKHS